MDKNKIMRIMLLITGTLSIIFFFLWIQKPSPAPYDEKLIKAMQKQLLHENDSLRKEINIEAQRSTAMLRKIDSLESIKSKTIIIYEKKRDEITAASADATVNDLKDIFAKNGVK